MEKNITPTSFTIRNDSENIMVIVHEPQAIEFELPSNEEIQIETNAVPESVVLSTCIANGKIVIAIHDNKSYYKVYHKGKEPFVELL